MPRKKPPRPMASTARGRVAARPAAASRNAPSTAVMTSAGVSSRSRSRRPRMRIEISDSALGDLPLDHALDVGLEHDFATLVRHGVDTVSYTHLRAHETPEHLV